MSVTTGFRHTEGIDASERVLPRLAQESGAFTVDFVRQPAGKPNAPQKPKSLKADATDDAKAAYKTALAKWEADMAALKGAEADYQARVKKELEKLSPENLKQYDAVVFNNTTGDLPLPDRQGFLDWIDRHNQQRGAQLGVRAQAADAQGKNGREHDRSAWN